MNLNLNCFNTKILISNENIIGMDLINFKHQIALVTVDNLCRLFLKVFDIENGDFVDIISLNDFHGNPKDFNLFNNVNKSSNDYYSRSLYLNDKILCKVNKFNSLSNNNFYLHLTIEGGDWHIEIDPNGNVIKKIEDDVQKRVEFYCDQNYIIFDIENFKEHKLFEFFDIFFESDDFSYNRVMDNYVFSLFLSSDNKKLGFIYFNKDDNSPRGNYSVFEVSDFNNPQLIFSYRIDECGNGHRFNSDNNKIVYRLHDEVVIRELDNNKFEKEIRIETNILKDTYHCQGVYNIKNFIVEVYYNKFYFLNINTKEYFLVGREVGSTYCIKEDKIFYTEGTKLKMITID
ncbi:hypothetical protein EAG11_00495 [Flavobacterium sp. 140616W15]|nr:hypothetical protein EAG11_00495 [Flavobacterium sp. 140616W15]